MRRLRALFLRLAALFRKDRHDREVAAELQSHLQLHIEDNLRAGMSTQEARRQALIKLGGMEQTREIVRERRRLPMLEILLQDLRYGMRMISKNPGFTIVATVTLALGIAVNATMFSLVSAFLLRRPPAHDPEHVVVVTSINPAPAFQADLSPLSAPNYLAWRDANQVFADAAAADQNRSINLTSQGLSAEAGQPEVLRSAAVSANYFSVLGVSAQHGRTFADGEDQLGRDHVTILSHELWERRFGSDTSLIGRTIRLNREDYSVVGVMPRNFQLLGFAPQLWTPLVLAAADQTAAARKDRSLYIFARLKPTATVDQARAEIVAMAHRAEENFPESEKGWGASVRTLPDFLISAFGIRSGLAVMMSTVGFVLMIACANVAGLLLARSARRRKELAVRLALGAGRIRVIRQLLTENLLIALLGGGLGLALAYWGINFMRARLSFNAAISAVPITLDSNVLLFTVVVSMACALLCGFAPALEAARTDINAHLKDESRASSSGRSHSRLRTIMVTGEIALALFLLIGTGLLIRGIFLIEHQNLGFEADHLLTAAVTLDTARYKDASQRSAFVRDILPRLQRLPGSEAVAVSSDLPSTGPNTVTLQIKGQPDLPANQRPTALDVLVTVDYFRTAGIPLLHGRAFTDAESATTPRIILVNQEFVRRHLNGQEPLGKQIRLDVAGAPPEWSEIVGVVGNVKTYSEATSDDPQAYEFFFQRPVPSFSLIVRSNADPDSLAPALREAVAQADVELPLDRLMSMDSVIERQRGGDVLFTRILGVFAILALILSAIGIYGLIAYSVGQRTHEIGIRLALGADRRDVLRMVLWEGLKMAAIGATVGLAMALPLPKLFDAIFFGLHFSELRLFFVVPLAILLVAMLATYIPARRATRVDPMVALRYE
ncbi:MAG TPA: ABC transporter permease [Candidatus Acidoferrum sp.]|nr:ABC transporter permease [Candidatus Acidoferrum sp.]